MLKKLFQKKQPPYDIFKTELLKKDANVKLLGNMIKSGEININHIDPNGETFLHIALKAKKIQSVLWLISNNIKAHIADNNGLTPFDIAINNQNHRIVRSLLNIVDVNIDKKDDFGRTVLQNSVVLGDHEMAKILLEHGADINSKDCKNRNVIYDAISYGNEEFIDYLLTFKHLELNNIDTGKNTILNHKSLKSNDNISIMLIEKGADPTILDKNGSSFLCNSALRGMEGLEIINCAVKKGFDINSRIANGNTILMEVIDKASLLNKEEDKDIKNSILNISKILISKGLDINAVNKENETVLFKAVRSGDEELVEFLLTLGINVNTQNKNSRTALAIAVNNGIENLKIIINLLKYKADPTIKNSEDKTLYEEINEIILNTKSHEQTGNQEMTKEDHKNDQYLRILKELLKYNEKDLNFLDSTGNPLFYKPLMHNHIVLFKIYAKAGLDIYKLNKDRHNLFFEYVVKVFEDDNEKIDFQSALSILISTKVDHNMQDETGWTAVSKIIATTPCNIKLFKSLVKVVRFNYALVDKLGRTAIHTAVWKGYTNVIRIINFVDPKIKNMPDHYGILPIVYAALLGNQKLVLTFIDIKAKATTDMCISQAAIKKFRPMLKNLEKLTQNIEDPLQLRQIKKVTDKIKSDFELDNCID